MNPILAKTLFEMDSGFGIPVGIVVFVLLVVKMLRGPDTSRTRSPRFWRSSPPSKPVDWEKHWAEQDKIKETKDAEWERKMTEWRKQQKAARD